MNEIKYILSDLRIEFISEEKEIHEAIKKVFDKNGVEYFHEHKLGKGSRIDFYLPKEKLGIEVKKKRPNRANLLIQVKRYLSFDSIEKLIVLSEKSVSLPEFVEGKEVNTMSINSLWF